MTSRNATGRIEPAGTKKSYRKPKTLSREKLEALALICSTGKSNGVGACAVEHMS
jgi:hypothetical protein